MQTKYCTLECCENLIQNYYERGGIVYQVDEGCLGLGTWILAKADESQNLREFVIEEYFINSWSSGHKVKIYTKGLPKKYQKILDENY